MKFSMNQNHHGERYALYHYNVKTIKTDLAFEINS